MTTTGVHALPPLLSEILAVMAGSAQPLSTTDIRLRLNENRPQPLVAEQVYRDLRRLADRGYVERVAIPGTPKAHWTLTNPSGTTDSYTMLTIEMERSAVFDWALRGAPAAALTAAGLPAHAHRIHPTPQLTNDLLGAAPDPLRPHARALRAAHREQQRLTPQQHPGHIAGTAQLLNPIWRVLSRVRLDLVALYGSRAGQYAQLVIAAALSTDPDIPDQAPLVFSAVTDTYRRLLPDTSLQPFLQPTTARCDRPEERPNP